MPVLLKTHVTKGVVSDSDPGRNRSPLADDTGSRGALHPVVGGIEKRPDHPVRLHTGNYFLTRVLRL
ncbi:MAG: hypothetical protein MUE45_08435 [Methanoregulaceae archaeon]|nr:hypothetical protein [Methanoregulaceae archaeon]